MSTTAYPNISDIFSKSYIPPNKLTGLANDDTVYITYNDKAIRLDYDNELKESGNYHVIVVDKYCKEQIQQRHQHKENGCPVPPQNFYES